MVPNDCLNFGQKNKIMIKFIIGLLLLFCAVPCQAQLPKQLSAGKKLKIAFNKNIEFLGFMYFITYEGINIETKMLEIDGQQVAEKDWQSYGYSFYQKYKLHAESSNAQTAMGIAEHLWLSHIIPLLLQVDDFPNAKLPTNLEEQYYLPFSKDKNSAKARANAQNFLSACNELYKEVDFGSYLLQAEKYYHAAIGQLKASVPSTDFMYAAEKFYRKKFDQYRLVPSLTLPKGMGFGSKLKYDDSVTVYSIFGAVDYQKLSDLAALDMGFGNIDKVREMGIHEFGHSFVNPEIEAFPSTRTSATSPLFKSISSAMESQGYNTWLACLSEHLVRAGEILIAEKLGNRASAERLQREFIEKRKFIYLPIALQQLRSYTANPRDSYEKTIDRILSILEEKVKADTNAQPMLTLPSEPRKAKFHTTDINLFWSVFDKTYPRFNADKLQNEYLDKGSIGLKGLIKGRIENGKNLSKVLRQQTAYYQYIRQYTFQIDKEVERIYENFQHLKDIYRKAVFPDVYFVIGANNSGGTIFENGLIVGAEKFGQPSTIHKPALDINLVDELICHELVHFQQNYAKDKSLLAQCIREGSADFICELIAGNHSNMPIYEYAETHKKMLQQEFLTKMNGNDWTGWLYYSKNPARKDVGYYIGYQICKKYYDKAIDKKQAIWDILNISDFRMFFEASGYGAN